MDPGIIPEARIHLPIEGHTRWPFIMRTLAFGSVATALVVGIIYNLLLVTPEDDTSSSLWLIIGLLIFLVGEFLVVRFAVVPYLGDYARFRITADRVEVFALSLLGFSANPLPEIIPYTEFSGVSARLADGSRRDINYNVFLEHKQRRRSLLVRPFVTHVQAEEFARSLARTLGLKYISNE